MIKNHAHHTFEPKYLLDYRALKILNNSTIFFIMPNGRKKKQILMMFNDTIQQSL